MEAQNLTAHQQVLLELFGVFDRLCRKHDIPYMLFAGSALGAVRHQGIIPWDDDLDVVMLRPHYKRFLEVASKELQDSTYFIQPEFSDHWPMFFSKLRKNGTACIERYVPKDTRVHQGIYIDIFPCDALSDNGLVRKLQFYASKVVISKSLYRRGYLTDSTAKKLVLQICRLLPTAPFLKLTRLGEREDTRWVHTFLGGAKDYEKNIYPREWMEESVEMTFCGMTAPVTKHYDALLTRLYGDYMTPLPEAQRGCKVHGEIVDTERSYEHYLQVQREMEITEYTRSIR